MTPSHRHGCGIVRREFLQVGFSGFLGLGLSSVLAARANAAKISGPLPEAVGRAKSVILVFLTGGPSHIDTFDPKPDAPDGIRGEFQAIATSAPGVRFSEHLPGLAARADKIAVVRSMSHGNTNHLNATHQLLTGQPQPGAVFDKTAARSDFPNYASTLEYLRPRADGVPSGVLLPTFLVEGPLIWPGQHAGFLGSRYDPWQIKADPSRADFREESLSLPVGLSVERLDRRRNLLDEVGALRDAEVGGNRSTNDLFAAQREQAYSLLLAGKVARAFDLAREDPKVRDRYGRHMYGQSLLLARRLVQAGVPIVQVNIGHVQNWDTHGANFKTLKGRLLPPTDQGVSALLDDLAHHGLLDETLVVVTGEFGRSPRIGKSAATTSDGRDHWPKVFSTAFAGAGVRGGQVIGESDKIGAYPAHSPHSPADLGATIYRALGIDPATELHDKLNRPIRLCDGSPIAALYSGTQG